MKKLVLLTVILFVTVPLFAQNVAITDDSEYSADASAMLDVKSTSKGFLAPRMTAAQRGSITSPATGLLVYQTDGTSGYYYYNGSSWIQFSSGELSQGKIFIGNSSGVATEQTLTGDVTLSEVGVTAIGNSKVTNDMLAGSISSDKLSGGITNWQLAGSITDDKLDIISSAGKVAQSAIQYGTYMITSAGSNGQVWTSDGSGAGSWESLSKDAVPDLVDAIQEQKKEIDELKAEIQAIKSMLEQTAGR